MQRNDTLNERRLPGQVFGVANETAILRQLSAKAHATRRMGGNRRIGRGSSFGSRARFARAA
jgi:hypothetical protein